MFQILSICKGGGYQYCRTDPPHPKANTNGLYPLHRVIVENHIGRLLTEEEVVHHKDENKTNDTLTNLEVLSRAQHSRHHQEVDLMTLECPACGTIFDLKPHAYRLRSKRSKGKELGCSRSCGAVLGRQARS